MGNTEHLARVYGYLAEVALWNGDLVQTAAWLTQSLAFQGNVRWLTFEFTDTLFVAARLATAQQAYALAAMRFGLAEQIRSHTNYIEATPMRPQIESALATVYSKLDATHFAEAFAVGQQMPLTEAFATILSALH
ncbi:MAG: hypothetical protein R2932_52545 [Caldilineaceae bacterium]